MPPLRRIKYCEKDATYECSIVVLKFVVPNCITNSISSFALLAAAGGLVAVIIVLHVPLLLLQMVAGVRNLNVNNSSTLCCTTSVRHYLLAAQRDCGVDNQSCSTQRVFRAPATMTWVASGSVIAVAVRRLRRH